MTEVAHHTGNTHSLEARNLNIYYGKSLAVEAFTLPFRSNSITALIGPSGSGKSTVLRSLNRMHEVVKDARVEGEVLLNGENIYGVDTDPVRIRRRIGMVFQKPNPFPMMSIYDNVIAGFKLAYGKPQGVKYDDLVEQALSAVGLWDEVKDKLRDSGAALSGGQQQRLCIARAIAVQPDILLMDEPCSALDPISTLKIEELMRELEQRYTIVLVTHNMQQATRVSDITAFLLPDERRVGRLIEVGPTELIFSDPQDPRTMDYVTGRMG
ncbi:MAG: phosphate ABC transporter ATP-binding protein [Anaerolineae bacterium]|nr:phosphate ABC transporter ATP-binding protein [Anaerolineae bacterium]MCA9908811.1 phosphate ABC transporter ATP-binding protein [Anaerolineae bacterium]